jgi:hypothetical protein
MNWSHLCLVSKRKTVDSTLTVPPVEAISVAEVDGIGSQGKTLGKSEGASVD